MNERTELGFVHRAQVRFADPNGTTYERSLQRYRPSPFGCEVRRDGDPMKAVNSMCWRFWMACESPQVAVQLAMRLHLHNGGRNYSRPTLRFRNVRTDGRVLLFDITYIARGANITDINRVLSKMCKETGGGWDTSFDDPMYVLLWSRTRPGFENNAEWPDLSDQDYAEALERHSAVLVLMGGVQDPVAV